MDFLIGLRCSLFVLMGYLGVCKYIGEFVMLIIVLVNIMGDYVINVY